MRKKKWKIHAQTQIVIVKLHCFSWLIPENFDKFFHNKRFCKTNATQNYIKTFFLKLWIICQTRQEIQRQISWTVLPFLIKCLADYQQQTHRADLSLSVLSNARYLYLTEHRRNHRNVTVSADTHSSSDMKPSHRSASVLWLSVSLGKRKDDCRLLLIRNQFKRVTRHRRPPRWGSCLIQLQFVIYPDDLIINEPPVTTALFRLLHSGRKKPPLPIML